MHTTETRLGGKDVGWSRLKASFPDEVCSVAVDFSHLDCVEGQGEQEEALYEEEGTTSLCRSGEEDEDGCEEGHEAGPEAGEEQRPGVELCRLQGIDSILWSGSEGHLCLQLAAVSELHPAERCGLSV